MSENEEILKLKEENKELKRQIENLARYKLDRVLASMKTRCYKKSCSQYKNYGGRGITVCEEWKGKGGLKNFIDWALKNGWNTFLTIDRIDVNGNYEPSNCRWVEFYEQCNNRTNNHILELNGEKHTASEWAKILDMPPNTIYTRIKSGWSDKEILTRPVRKRVPH